MAICFTEHSLPANEDLALIFLADFDLSFLKRIHSIHVDATFKTVLPATDYSLSCCGHNNTGVLFPHVW